MITNPLSVELARASEAFRRKDFASAARLYEHLASQGHVESIVMIGWLRLNGLGTALDETKAMDSFRQAASLGSAVGQFYWARYLTKMGEYAQALPLYRRASLTGHLPSTFWVGYATSRGQGVDKSPLAAYPHLVSAAKGGHMQALRELSVLDIKGHRGTQWRFLAPFEFTLAVFGTLVLAIFAPQSDRLRA